MLGALLPEHGSQPGIAPRLSAVGSRLGQKMGVEVVGKEHCGLMALPFPRSQDGAGQGSTQEQQHQYYGRSSPQSLHSSVSFTLPYELHRSLFCHKIPK